MSESHDHDHGEHAPTQPTKSSGKAIPFGAAATVPRGLGDATVTSTGPATAPAGSARAFSQAFPCAALTRASGCRRRYWEGGIAPSRT
jgi:hypothetical protein